MNSEVPELVPNLLCKVCFVVFASVLLPKISGIVPRSNSISYVYVDVTILEEKLVGQFWDIGRRIV